MMAVASAAASVLRDRGWAGLCVSVCVGRWGGSGRAPTAPLPAVAAADVRWARGAGEVPAALGDATAPVLGVIVLEVFHPSVSHSICKSPHKAVRCWCTACKAAATTTELTHIHGSSIGSRHLASGALCVADFVTLATDCLRCSEACHNPAPLAQ